MSMQDRTRPAVSPRPFLLAWLGAIAVVTLWRVFGDPASGAPSVDSDFGAHLAIAYKLARGELWPPLYQGMLGSHALAAALGLFTDGPKSWLLLRDFSLLAVVAALGFAIARRRSWTLGLLSVAVFAVVGLNYAGDMAQKGFFPQLVAWGFYAWALVIADNGARPPLAALVLLLLGAGTYPDHFLWLGFFFAWRLRPSLWAAALCAGLWLMQLSVLGLQGQISFPGAAWLQLWLAVLALVVGMWRARRDPGASVLAGLGGAYALIVLGTVLAALAFHLRHPELPPVGYYARKNLYGFALLAPFFVLALRPRAEAWLWVGLAALPIMANRSILFPLEARQLAGFYLHPRSPDFSARDETCARRLVEKARAAGCLDFFVLPGSRERELGQPVVAGEVVGSYAYNALAGTLRADFYVGRLTHVNGWFFGERQRFFGPEKPADLPEADLLARLDRDYDPDRRYECYFFPARWRPEDAPDTSPRACDGARDSNQAFRLRRR